MASESSAAPGGTGSEDAVRGELVEKEGQGLTLVAVRRLRWGTAILGEKPLLLVEDDPKLYLKARDADPRLWELAEAMGDHQRVATYVAFKQLHERKQKELLAFWRDGLEENDRIAKAIHEQNEGGCNAFLEDSPEFSKLIYWRDFVKVISVFGRFGLVNPDGTRAVYALCSYIRHSNQPNAAWFTLKRGYPKGRKVLHVIGNNGIEKGAEIKVSLVPESVLLLPKAQRCLRVRRITGQDQGDSDGSRSEADDGEIRELLLEKLPAALATKPPTDTSTKEAEAMLRRLDILLPFSMQMKAKAKVMLAQALQELNNRAAWQADNKEANIIQWTGMDGEAQEQRLKATKKLYESASRDFEYLLGQDAIGILNKLEVGYGPVADQHKMISQINKEKKREAAAAASASSGGNASGADSNRLPPAWEEALQKRASADEEAQRERASAAEGAAVWKK